MRLRVLGAVATALGVLAAGVRSPGQQAPRGQPATYFAYLTLLDRRGAPVAAVTPADLTLRAGGDTNAEIERLAPASEPLVVTVLVDQCTPAVMEMRDALKAFSKALAGQNRIALVTVDGPPTVLVPSTSDVAPLVAAIEGFRRRACLGLNVIEAIRDSYRSTDIVNADRPTVVAVVGHGNDWSHDDVSPVLNEMQDGRASLFVVRYLPEQSSAAGEQSHLAALLIEGPALTGGLRFDLLSPAGLRSQLLKVAAILAAQHRVEFGLGKEPPWNRPFRLQASATQAGFRVLITGARRVSP